MKTFHFGFALAGFLAGLITPTFAQGIYSGPTDTAHSIDGAIPATSSLFVEFADAIDLSRTGFTSNGSLSISSTGFNTLGDLTATQIAAGETPGFLTVTFPTGIADGDGHDFAVFENGFVFPESPFLFAELAYVEVSSNGTDFACFDSISSNTTFQGTTQAFGGFDVTNVYNLAGKHANGFGTPFDLNELRDHALVAAGDLNLNNIQYLRLVDIPGSGDFLDSLGNPILDAWPANGFDFRLPAGQGVGVINRVGVLLLGDTNRDRVVNFLDIAPFIALLSTNAFQGEADINQSGSVDFLDIAPFISLLSSQ